MKRIAIFTGITSIILITLGAFAKTMHWPGAAISLTLGTFVLVFVFSPTALINNYNQSAYKSKFFYVSVFLTVALLFISALFKILHWPGAGVLLIIGTLFPFVILIPALLVFNKKNKSFTVSNLITVLLFLAYSGVSSTFLALNISKDMIDEAAIVQKEMQELNDMANGINKNFIDEFKTSELIFNAHKVKKDMDEINEKLLEFPNNKNINNLLLNPKKINYKDNNSFVATILSHQNPDLIQTAIKFKNYEETLKEMPLLNNISVETPEIYQNRLIYRAGNNPKIWAIATLTAIKSQIEIQEHLFLKEKILNEPPE